MKIRFKLIAKKSIYVPTLLGWLVLLVCGATVSVVCVGHAYSFLAYDKPANSNIFIIEGWVPDHVLEKCPEFRPDKCGLILSTGGPLEYGSYLSQYNNYAEVTLERLVALGFRSDSIVAVPNEEVDKGRTYAAALAVRQWLADHPDVTSANLISLGPHARRSYMTFKQVLPPTFELGVYAARPADYDSEHWWRYSEGFRTVISEGVAYFYARFIRTH